MLKLLSKFFVLSFYIGFVPTACSQYFRTNLNFQSLHNKYQILSFDFAKLDKLSLDQENFNTVLNLGQYGTFEIQISPSNLLMKKSQIYLSDGNKNKLFKSLKERQWKGKVKGTSHLVRLNIYSNCLSGMIETDSGDIFIETFIDNEVSKLLVYNSKDNQSFGSSFCKTGDSVSAHIGPSTNNPGINYVNYSCGIVKISNVASYNLFKQHNYDTVACLYEIRDVFNLSDAVYARDIKIRLKIASEFISLDSTSLMCTSSNTSERLNSLKSNKKKFEGAIEPDIIHLFNESYIPTDNAVGIAVLNGVCSNNNISCSEGYSSTINYWSKVFSHEIGHNLGANHSDAVNCGPSGSIMCQGSANFNKLYFGQTEINVISSKVTGLLSSTNVSTYCLEYPINNSIEDFDAFGTDSVLVELVVDKDFNAQKIQLPNGQFKSVNGLSEVWLKTAGEHYLITELDTVSGLECNMEDYFFIAKGDFVVRNSHVFGPGSLGNAILNSNVHKGMDTIKFDLPVNQSNVLIDSLLPPIIDSCVIDGSTQKGFKFANKNSIYMPSVGIIDKMTIPFNSDRHCFNLAKERYVIKNLYFEGFYTPIYAFMDYFNYKANFSKYFGGIKDSNFLSEYIIQGNKFNKYTRAIYLNGFVVNNSSDRILIGGDSLYESNFFMDPRYNAGRIPYSMSTTIKNNYFGLEPGTESVVEFNEGFSFNTTQNLVFSHNHFGRFKGNALSFDFTDGMIEGNTFGYNPFNQSVLCTKGKMVFASSGSQNGILNIGDTSKGAENVFYGSANESVIQISADKNVKVSPNKIISNDSFFIISTNWEGKKPFKKLVLDSVSLYCHLNYGHKVYGSIQPIHAYDTFLMDFYAVTESSKGRKVSPYKYLGKKVIYCEDTLIYNFRFTLDGASANDGIIAVATSNRIKLTGENSEVVFPDNRLQTPIVLPADTILCPQETFKLQLNQPYNELFVNGTKVSDGYELDRSGLYEIEARTPQGCKATYPLTLNYHPDYLKYVSILGPNKYIRDSSSVYYIEPISYGQYWNSHSWQVDSSTTVLSEKYFIESKIKSKRSNIKYIIKDIKGCANFIQRKINSSEILKMDNEEINNVLTVYPNPSFGGIIQFNQPIFESVTLYNLQGKVVSEYEADELGITDLSLEGLATGNYYLFVKGKGGVMIVVE